MEDMLQSHPSLAADDDAILKLIHVEILARNEVGQKPTLSEWQERFPRLLSRIEHILPLRNVFGSEMPTLSDPTSRLTNPQASVQARSAAPDRQLPDPSGDRAEGGWGSSTRPDSPA